MTFAVVFTAAALALAAPDTPFDVQARAACSAPMGAEAEVSGVEVVSFPATGGDLPGLRVTHQPSGAWMNIYFDASSESAARARAACLGAELAYLHDATGDTRSDAQWAGAVFTADADYAQPAGMTQTRWEIHTTGGEITDAVDEMLLVTLPHEQVHNFQGRHGAQTPRWFHEGHAVWVGRKVAQRVSPNRSALDAEAGAADLNASMEPVALARWGGVSVKREAILRQVNPEDRARMEADPTYMPKVSLTFGPGDMVSDESNTAARYEASWMIFRDIEAARGALAVQTWVRNVTAGSGRIETNDVVTAAGRVFDFDLPERLE